VRSFLQQHATQVPVLGLNGRAFVVRLVDLPSASTSTSSSSSSSSHVLLHVYEERMTEDNSTCDQCRNMGEDETSRI
jgi:hypothetical protein